MLAYVASLAFVLLPAAEPEPAFGPGTTEFEAMKRRVDQDRQRVAFLIREEASIIGALQTLDREIADKRARSAQLADELRRLEVSIASSDEEARENEEALLELRERAGVRAGAMQRLHRTRLGDLARRLRAQGGARRLREDLGRLLAYDAELLRAARGAVEGAKQAHERATRTRAELLTTRAQLDREAAEGALLREERALLLAGVRKERAGSEKLAREIVQAAKRLEAELGVVRGQNPAPPPAPGGFEAQRGKLPWPTVGRVEVPFGKKVDPGSGMVMVQKGIDLRAELDAPVRPVFPGQVVYADWLEGFGQLVIVEHDGGHYTLYAHLGAVEVEKGDQVDPSTALGTVGDSGSTKGAYLYFEVRKGRDALDPLRWLSP